MALVYFDSSALVKLVVEEDGSDVAAELWDGCDAALASRLAYPEVRAALAAACRNHDLSEHDLDTAEQAWEQHWAAVRPVELTAAVERHRRRAGPLVLTARRRRRTPSQRPGHRRSGPHTRRLGPAATRRRRHSRTVCRPGTPARHLTPVTCQDQRKATSPGMARCRCSLAPRLAPTP